MQAVLDLDDEQLEGVGELVAQHPGSFHPVRVGDFGARHAHPHHFDGVADLQALVELVHAFGVPGDGGFGGEGLLQVDLGLEDAVIGQGQQGVVVVGEIVGQHTDAIVVLHQAVQHLGAGRRVAVHDGVHGVAQARHILLDGLAVLAFEHDGLDELLRADQQVDHRFLAGIEFADHRQDVLGGHLVEDFDQGVIAFLFGDDDEVGFSPGDLPGEDEFAGFLDD